MFIGFLSRSNNPTGKCMPCCFKKDPVISKNNEKKEYFMKSIKLRFKSRYLLHYLSMVFEGLPYKLLKRMKLR